MCKKCSTSGAHFFAAAGGESLLSALFSGVSPKLSGLLASVFTATSN